MSDSLGDDHQPMNIRDNAVNFKRQYLIVCVEQSLSCGLTYRILLADVFHNPHEAIADALFISVLAHSYTSPVALFVLAPLKQQLPTLKNYT